MRPRVNTGPARRRRGTALFAVLFLVVVATLSAASMLTATAAERTAAVRSLDELELRMAIRSALAVATADLALQRDGMLAGERPEPPSSVRIDRGEDAPGIVVEFVAGADGFVLRPEAARLDLNLASKEALEKIPGISRGLADAIVRRRESAPFRSVAEALRLSPSNGSGGVGAEDPASDPADVDPGSDGPSGTGLRTEDLPTAPGSGGADDDRDAASSPFGGSGAADPSLGDASLDDPFAGERESGGDAATAWTGFVTVFSADPQVSCGAVDPDRLGLSRVNVNAPWSDQLERSVGDAVGDGAGTDDALRTLFVNAPRLGSSSALVGLLNNQSVPREEWRRLLDALTTTPDPFRLGLVDVNTAPAEVLAALPGLDARAAEAIVDARERVDLSDRLSLVWLLDEAVVTDEQFLACVDRLAVRSLQWRFVLRASFEDEGDTLIGFDPGDAAPALLPEADEFGVAIDEGGENRAAGPSLEFEVVMDLADPTPRVAYLRERTAFDLAIAVASLPGFMGDPAETDRDSIDEEPLDEALDDVEDDADAETATALRGSRSSSSGRGLGDSEFGGSIFDDEPDPDEPDGRGAVSSPDGAADEDRGGRVGSRSGSGGGASGGRGASPSSSGDNRLGRWAPARDRSRRGGGGDG